MPHIAVISELELGSHKAHAINVIKTAGGLARLGHTVTLLCRPPRWARDCGCHAPELLEQYAEPSLRCELQPFPWTEDEAGSLATGVWAARRAQELGADAVYARHFTGPLECVARALPTVMETHAHVGAVKPILDECFRATRADHPLSVVTISARLRDYYISRGADPGRVHVVADGVDLDLFTPRPCENPFEGPGPHAVYCGHLYDYKGIPTILGAAALAPHTRFHLIGGTHEDETRLRAAVAFQELANVKVHGHVCHNKVPPYLWHADVLLLPPSAKDPSAGWTSPVKLGEYLASGRPVVASAIPGLQDWVDAPAVRWFEPDNAQALACSFAAALAETPADAALRRRAALELARRFSYPNRARQILEVAWATPARTQPDAVGASRTHFPRAA